MTPRERILATLKHQQPDKVPIALGWRGEIMAGVMKHYKVETPAEVVKILDADLNRFAGLQTRIPEFDKKVNGEVKGSFGSSGPAIVHDARTFEDEWGIVQRVGSDGKYLEWVRGPFVDNDDLDNFTWPDGRNIVENPGLAEQVAAFKKQGYWVVGNGGVHPFKHAWHMRGFENFLCDYMTNPGWVERIYDRFLAYNIPLLQKGAAAGIDQFEYWGDVAMQDRMIVPPQRWRELDKPMWRRLIAATRQVKPDVKFFFHSDGDVSPIIGDIIEVGFDILNPIQPECVNPGLIKKKWGGRITLDGGGSIQRTIPLGTLADIKAEVEFLMTTCAYDGGYVFRASNVVNFDCPIQNVVAYYELARDFDLSTISGPPAHIPDPPCLKIRTDGFAHGTTRLD